MDEYVCEKCSESITEETCVYSIVFGWICFKCAKGLIKEYKEYYTDLKQQLEEKGVI